MKKLIVEVDFEHSEKHVTCRLYHSENGHRKLLRVQDICNLIQRIRAGLENGWNGDDIKILKQFWPIISTPHIMRTNLQVVKVPKRKFDLWLELWKDNSDRFVEKKSQQSYSQSLVMGAIHFELECHGALSTLSAVFISETNQKIPYYQLARERVCSESQFLFEGQRFDVKIPIKPEIMDQLFAEKNPQIPTNKIEAHLPIILQGRLDLLQGPSVKKIDNDDQLKIILKSEGADILIGVFVGPEAIQQFQKDPMEPMKLRQKGKVFEILSYSHKLLPDIKSAFSTLPLEKSYKEYWKLQGTNDNIKRLYGIYTNLRSKISFDIESSLRSLFENGSTLQPTMSIQEGRGWLDVHVQCHLGKIPIDCSDIQQAIDSHIEFVRTRGGDWLRLDFEAVNQLNNRMDELGLRLGQQRVTNLFASNIVTAVDAYPDLRVHESSSQMLNRLRGYNRVGIPQYPSHLLNTLRPYQKEGADFLSNRTGYDLGCILADDMGLGKTLQVLAFLSAQKSKCRQSLKVFVICPASVTSVWTKEAKRFTPELRIGLLIGSKDKRRSILKAVDSFNILVGSYAMIRNDISLLKNQRFDVVILDEAQQIKNPKADISRAVKSLSCKHRIALTGTPLENKIMDLWSIVDFLNPGYLGTLTEFKNRTVGDLGSKQRLSKKISPLLLRRLKSQVAPQLPPKMEETLTIPLSDFQAHLYKQELARARPNVTQSGAIEVLAALMRLRQICNHPQLLPSPTSSASTKNSIQGGGDTLLESSKLKVLMEHLLELQEEGHSALVFSQFTTMLDIIQSSLQKQAVITYKITGATAVPKRARIIDEFQSSPKPAVFLLSLKAAGTGLTLTKADYVFIYDPWWNPAAENQAIDRTHRIGQDKPVIAYRLVAANTVEEKIMKLKEEKQHLFSQIIDGSNSLPSNLTMDDLIAILG